MFTDHDPSLLMTFVHISSGVSRVVFGKLADFKRMNILFLEQITFLLLGIVIICIPLIPYYEGLIVISVLFGVCDGIIWMLMGPIPLLIVGTNDAAQAIGFSSMIFAVFFAVASPVAGKYSRHFIDALSTTDKFPIILYYLVSSCFKATKL